MHVCRDCHCLKVCSVFLFYILVHIVVIVTMRKHENNIKFTIFHWDLWVLLLHFAHTAFCSHDTTKEQRHQTQYRK